MAWTCKGRYSTLVGRPGLTGIWVLLACLSRVERVRSNRAWRWKGITVLIPSNLRLSPTFHPSLERKEKKQSTISLHNVWKAKRVGQQQNKIFNLFRVECLVWASPMEHHAAFSPDKEREKENREDKQSSYLHTILARPLPPNICSLIWHRTLAHASHWKIGPRLGSLSSQYLFYIYNKWKKGEQILCSRVILPPFMSSLFVMFECRRQPEGVPHSRCW